VSGSLRAVRRRRITARLASHARLAAAAALMRTARKSPAHFQTASDAAPLPAPDLLLENPPGGWGCIIAPCHRRAADWLRVSAPVEASWVGEALIVADPAAIVTGAVQAGFAVALAFQEFRVLPGLTRREQQRASQPRRAVPKRPS